MTDPRTPGRQRSFIERSIVQLTIVRFREFIRQPEAVFWTFVFPILLAVGLGLAFRSRGPEEIKVAVVARPDAAAVMARLGADSAIAPQVLDDSAAAKALRTGKVALVIVPAGANAVDYLFDPQRGESRTARLVTDAALQKGAGRTDPIAVADRTISDKGSRYIDFVIPGLLESSARPIQSPATGAEHRVRISLPNGIEFDLAEIASGTTRTMASIALDVRDSYFHFSALRQSGEGVVRS